MSNRNRPPAKRDATGECMHLYLTRDAQCVHCGMQFRLAWTADRNWLTAPLRKNLGFGIASILVTVALYYLGIDYVSVVALFASIYFMVRAVYGTAEVFMKHKFSPGKLGELVMRPRYNIIAMKPGVAFVGLQRYPMDEQTYRQFTPGDTLLVEYMRWSRMPVAIYRGHLNR